MKQFFIDDSGKYSMGRLLCFLIVIFCLLQSVYHVIFNEGILDLPMTWAGFAAALYGINKFSPTYDFTGGGEKK